MLKPTIQVTLFSICGILINFIIQLVLAYFFGASEDRDAFFAASSIPAYINVAISGSLIVVFLPRLIDIEVRKDGNSFTLISSMTTFLVLLLLFISLPLLFFSRQLVGFLFQGFDERKIELTGHLLLILCPALIFQALSNILIAVFHSNKLFLKPSGSFLITPIVTIIAAYFLAGYVGITSVAIGSSIGWILTFAFLQFYAGAKYKINFSFLFTDKDFHYCLRKSMPLFLGSLIFRGNTVIEKMIASNFSGGVISYLGYAGNMVNILSTVTINGIATTMFPHLSQTWSEKKMEKFRSYYSNSLKITLILCVPIIVLTIVFSKTIVATVLERGAFDHNDTIEVSYLLTVLMGSYLFLCLNTISGKVFYVTGITRIGLFNAFFEVFLYTGLSILLSKYFSYYGIAYAQVISVACSTLLASIILQLKFKILDGRSLFKDYFKIILCGFLAYALMNSFYFWFKEQSFLIMLFFGGAAIMIYFYVLSVVLKEARQVRYLIQDKIQNLIFSK
ncbi:MAG TPA: lipid II flippase MurJ [Flavitalea sp.]|nr:lipid II flippase MurJ [Flavitalea sp.]